MHILIHASTCGFFFSFVKLTQGFVGQIPDCESLVGNYSSNASQCRDKERRWTLLVF